MTPEREAYLAKCGDKEVWLRSAIRATKRDISYQKQRISNANEEWIATGAKCELWNEKQLLMTLRHELQRIKGMDRVVIPSEQYDRRFETYNWYCTKCDSEISVFENYCPTCGRKILWKKVSE